MRATIMYRAGDVRVENVPDATISNQRMLWFVSPEPASAAVICGPTGIWNQPKKGSPWAMKPSASSKPSVRT